MPISSNQIQQLRLRYTVAQETYEREHVRATKAKLDLEIVREARAVAQTVAATVQQQAHRRIAEVVTRCLEAVFGEEAYRFQIQFEEKRGRTEARLLFVRDGLEIDPLSGAGGGVVDVAAFALRLSVLVLSRPVLRRVLFLDEPFRYVSREYWPAVRRLLESLAEEMQVQIVMVTHQEGLRTGTIIEVGGE